MPPRKILFATDLSCRCDRAMDRAALLAKGWNAQLVVVHALEEPSRETDAPSWRRGRHPRDIAREQVLSDLGGAPNLDLDLVIERRDAAELILETADRFECDLVVTGMARDEAFGRVILGDAVQNLARKVRAPLLVVKRRPHGAYWNVCVATDFSEGSRRALETAVEFVPEAEISLFHAFDLIHEEYMTDKMAAREAEAAKRTKELRAFLDKTPSAIALARPIQMICEYGKAGPLLDELTHVRGMDLVVIGKEGRNVLTRGLFGSNAERLLAKVPTDILVSGPKSA